MDEWGAGIARRRAFLGEENLKYIGCPERPGNNERLGRRGNFIALERSMCVCGKPERCRSQAREGERGGKGCGGEIYRIFEILVHSACRTRRLHFSTASIYLILFFRSHFTLSVQRPPPSLFPLALLHLLFSLLLLSSILDTPFTRFPVTSLPLPLVVSFPFRFRSSAGSARPMIPDFSIPWLPAGTRCLSEVRTRKKSPKGNIVPGIENRISQGIGFIRIVVYIFSKMRSRDFSREARITLRKCLTTKIDTDSEAGPGGTVAFVCALFFLPMINKIFFPGKVSRTFREHT